MGLKKLRLIVAPPPPPVPVVRWGFTYFFCYLFVMTIQIETFCWIWVPFKLHDFNYFWFHSCDSHSLRVKITFHNDFKQYVRMVLVVSVTDACLLVWFLQWPVLLVLYWKELIPLLLTYKNISFWIDSCCGGWNNTSVLQLL